MPPRSSVARHGPSNGLVGLEDPGVVQGEPVRQAVAVDDGVVGGIRPTGHQRGRIPRDTACDSHAELAMNVNVG